MSGATLMEALVASILIVTIIGTGFVLVQRHLRMNYNTKLRIKMVQKAEAYMDKSISQREYFVYSWDESPIQVHRSIFSIENSELIQLSIVLQHANITEPIKISRIVKP